MKQTVKLNENKFRELIKKNIRQILNEGENYGWVVESNEAQEAYDLAVQYMGKEYVDDAIVGTLGNEKLADCLAYLFRMWDFREWDDRNSEEDDDEELYEAKLNEYEGMDDSWSPVAVFGENQRDIYNMLWQVKLALQKKIKRGDEIRKDILANSSVIHRAAQISLKRFNEYNKEVGEEPFYMDNAAKRGLREYYAQKILDWIDEEKINNQPKSEDEVINETLKRIFKNIKNQ